MQSNASSGNGVSPAASVVIKELGASRTLHLRREILNRLQETPSPYPTDASSPLPDYIIALLANKHSPERIKEELTAFLGAEEVSGFVVWLVETVERFKTAAVFQQQAPPQPPAEPTGGRAFQIAFKDATVANNMMMDVDDNRTSGMMTVADVNAAQRKNKEERVGAVSQPQRPPFHHQRALDHRFPLPKNYDPYAPENRPYSDHRSTSEHQSYHPSLCAQAPEHYSFRDSGRSRNSRTAPGSSRTTESRPQYFEDRNRIGESSGDPSGERVRDYRPPKEEPAETKAPVIKCQYWPNCRSGAECPFFHPTEPCKYFPNCTHGHACLRIHPQVPCRYQEKCINPTCNYIHRGDIGGGSSTALAEILCKFHPRCSNPSCPFLHPLEKPCRLGANCTRTDCHFQHPEGRNITGKSLVNLPCRFGKQCTRVLCPYQHLNNGSSEAVPMEEDNTTASMPETTMDSAQASTPTVQQVAIEST